jgi:hypothetical protein
MPAARACTVAQPSSAPAWQPARTTCIHRLRRGDLLWAQWDRDSAFDCWREAVTTEPDWRSPCRVAMRNAFDCELEVDALLIWSEIPHPRSSDRAPIHCTSIARARRCEGLARPAIIRVSLCTRRAGAASAVLHLAEACQDHIRSLPVRVPHSGGPRTGTDCRGRVGLAPNGTLSPARRVAQEGSCNGLPWAGHYRSSSWPP